MNYTRFLIYTLLQAILITVVKVYFFQNIDFSQTSQTYLLLAAIAVISGVFARILGVINFFEAFYIMAVWFILDSFLDLTITTSFVGYGIYKTKELWLGYLVLLLAIAFFHQKIHIEIRKKLHAKHH